MAVVRGRSLAGGSGLAMVQLAPDWLSWWRGTDAPAASEPAGCDTWWGSPGESAPEGHTDTGVLFSTGALWEMQDHK